MPETMVDNIPSADTADAPVADSPTTESDFDALLREFDEATAKAPDQSAGQAPDRTADILAQREGLLGVGMQRLQQEGQEIYEARQQLQQEYDARDEALAIGEIRGNLSSEFFDDQMVSAWLMSQAQKDNRIFEAWNNRAQNPRAYNAIVGKLAGEFQEKYRRLPDPVATVDHELVAQSMRGQGGKVPDEPPANVGRMGTDEYRRHVRDTYGYDPSV